MEGLLSLLLFAGFFYFMMRFGCGAHLVHGHAGHKPGRDGTGSGTDASSTPLVTDQSPTTPPPSRPV